jgi:hypothetical protein
MVRGCVVPPLAAHPISALALAALLSACAPTPPPPPAVTISSANEGPRDAAPPAPETPKQTTCPDHARALERARARAAAGDLDSALAAYDEAVRARPLDAATRVERARARMSKGLSAEKDIAFARSLTSDRSLLAAAWMLAAEAAAKDGDQEGERIALALAERHGAAEAARKLGAASRCTATWTTDVSDDVPLATSFRELAAAQQLVSCDAPAPRTEAEAKRRVCRGCGNEDGCRGKPPWSIATGTMHFHSWSFFVELLRPGLYYFENRADGGGARARRLEGDVLAVDREGGEVMVVDGAFGDGSREVYVTARGFWSDEEPDEGEASDAGAPCAPLLAAEVKLSNVLGAGGGAPAIDVRGPMIRTYFDVRLRRPLLRLRTWDDGVRASFARDEASIRGAGCSGEVPLQAAPKQKRYPPRP